MFRLRLICYKLKVVVTPESQGMAKALPIYLLHDSQIAERKGIELEFTVFLKKKQSNNIPKF